MSFDVIATIFKNILKKIPISAFLGFISSEDIRERQVEIVFHKTKQRCVLSP